MSPHHHSIAVPAVNQAYRFQRDGGQPSQSCGEHEPRHTTKPQVCSSALGTVSPLVRKIVLVLLIHMICQPASLQPAQADDETSDWDRWDQAPVTAEQQTSLTKQMAQAGLVALRRDARTFLPEVGTRLRLQSIPEQSLPFGLLLANGSTSDAQLSILAISPNLYSLTLRGFPNGTMAAKAVCRQPNLRYLSLLESGIQDEDLSQFVDLKYLETLDLRGTRIRGSGLARLKKLPALQSLEVDMTEEQFRSLAGCELIHLLPIASGADKTTVTNDADIVELDLNGFYGYTVTNEMLQNIEQLSSLRELSLIESQVDNDAIPQLVRIKKLEKLNLERCRIDDDALQVLATACQLRSLVLDETKITVQGLQHLEELESLTEIHLNRCKIDDASLKALGILPRLERLEIGQTEIGFEHKANPGAFAKLEHLNVNGSKVTDSGIANIAQLPELKWLDLTRCRISNEGLKSLAACRKLEVLYLNLTPISDKDLLPLSSIESLRILSLNSTAITDVGLRHLSGMKGLRSLILFGTQTSQAAVQQLQSELPDCEIVR